MSDISIYEKAITVKEYKAVDMTEVKNLKGKTRMEVNSATRMKKPYVRNFNEDAASLVASQKRCQWTLIMIKFDKYSILLSAVL
jgi:hypothetical protein